MRRSIGLALVGLGVLLLVVAPLLRWYAYPRLAVVSDASAELVSTGHDVTVLDHAAVVTQQGPVERTTDVRSVRRIVPDVDAGSDARAVWETSVTTIDTQGDGGSAEPDVLSYLEERVAFDRHAGHAVDGGGQYVSRTDDEADAESIEHAGYLFKLPFGTERRDYDFWDGELRATRPMEFVAAGERGGLDVYRFEQRIEPTVIAEMDAPGALFDRSGAVTAEHVYGGTRTIWVEPHTGAIIDGRHEIDSFLRFDGERGPAVVQGTLAYTDEQVAANVAEYSETADELALLRDTLPLAGVVAGSVVLVAGVLLARRATASGRGRRPGSATTPEPAPAPGSTPRASAARAAETDAEPSAQSPGQATGQATGEPESRTPHPILVADPEPVVFPEPIEPEWTAPEQPPPRASAPDPVPATEAAPAANVAPAAGERSAADLAAGPSAGPAAEPGNLGRHLPAWQKPAGHDLADEFDEFDEDAQGPGQSYRY